MSLLRLRHRSQVPHGCPTLTVLSAHQENDMATRKPQATPARILTAAADHIERVGLYQGEHL